MSKYIVTNNQINSETCSDIRCPTGLSCQLQQVGFSYIEYESSWVSLYSCVFAGAMFHSSVSWEAPMRFFRNNQWWVHASFSLILNDLYLMNLASVNWTLLLWHLRISNFLFRNDHVRRKRRIRWMWQQLPWVVSWIFGQFYPILNDFWLVVTLIGTS